LHEEQHPTSQLGLAQDNAGFEIINMAYATQGR